MSDEDLRYGDVVRLVVCADAGASRIVRGEGHVLRNLTAVQPERRVGDDAEFCGLGARAYGGGLMSAGCI